MNFVSAVSPKKGSPGGTIGVGGGQALGGGLTLDGTATYVVPPPSVLGGANPVHVTQDAMKAAAAVQAECRRRYLGIAPNVLAKVEPFILVRNLLSPLSLCRYPFHSALTIACSPLAHSTVQR